MAECQRCKGAAHNAFLCPQCIEELHQELSNLGWWLDRLTETAESLIPILPEQPTGQPKDPASRRLQPPST